VDSKRVEKLGWVRRLLTGRALRAFKVAVAVKWVDSPRVL